jgi:hypothetical protein
MNRVLLNCSGPLLKQIYVADKARGEKEMIKMKFVGKCSFK